MPGKPASASREMHDEVTGLPAVVERLAMVVEGDAYRQEEPAGRCFSLGRPLGRRHLHFEAGRKCRAPRRSTPVTVPCPDSWRILA